MDDAIMDDAIRTFVTPTPLRDPVLIAAFQGGGSLTPGIVAGLFERYEPTPLAEIDADEFYDFTAVRPIVRLVDGEREIAWPQIRFQRVALDDRDLVVLSAIEPNLGWRRLAGAIREVSRAFGIQEVILLSSFTGATPHTRPIPVQWLAVSRDVPARFGREARRPRYQGPATFSMALGAMLRDAGFSVGTLNAIAPFYLGVEPNPYAIRALARALEGEFGVRFDLDEVERQVAEVERQAAAQAEGSQQLRMFLANLEQQYDEMQTAEIPGAEIPGALDRGEAESAVEGATGGVDAGTTSRAALPETDHVLADVEALLREHRGPGQSSAEGSRAT